MRNLFRDTLIYGASAVLSRGLSLIVLPIYTRILSPSDYGALDMIMVVGTLANLIVALEIAQALARHLGEAGSPEERQRLSSTALYFTLFAYLLCTSVAMLLLPPITRAVLGDESFVPAMRIGIGIIAVNGCFFLLQNQLRFELRSIAYAQVSVFYAALVTGLGLWLGFGLGLGLEGVLLSQLLAATAAVLLCIWHLRNSYRLVFDTRWLTTMLRFSMPLVPSGLATFVTLYANRLVLNTSATLDEVGMFGVAARIAGLVSLLIVGLQSSLTPWIYATYQETETPRQLARLTEWFVAAALLVCLALGAFSDIVMEVIAPKFIASAPIVMPIALATLMGQMSIFLPGIAIAKRTKQQLLIFMVTAIVSAALNLALVPAGGVTGAAAATLLSSLFFLAIWYVVSQRYYPLPIAIFRIASASAAFAVAATGAHLLVMSEMPLALTIVVRLMILFAFLGWVTLIGLVSPRLLTRQLRAARLPWRRGT